MLNAVNFDSFLAESARAAGFFYIQFKTGRLAPYRYNVDGIGRTLTASASGALAMGALANGWILTHNKHF